jgi:hypothetical protein
MNHITSYSPRELHEMMQGLTHAETVNLLWRVVKDCRAYRRAARSINDSDMRGYITSHYRARYAAALRGARWEVFHREDWQAL